MSNKKVLLISGIVGPLKSSNKSFTNTVKGYLNNGFKVYHYWSQEIWQGKRFLK